MPVEVRDEQEQSRFEVLADGEPAGRLVYRRRREGEIELVHTEVDDAYAGRGLAQALATHALDTAREQGLAVVPSCPFVAEFIRRDPSYVDLVPPDRRAEFDLA